MNLQHGPGGGSPEGGTPASVLRFPPWVRWSLLAWSFYVAGNGLHDTFVGGNHDWTGSAAGDAVLIVLELVLWGCALFRPSWAWIPFVAALAATVTIPSAGLLMISWALVSAVCLFSLPWRSAAPTAVLMLVWELGWGLWSSLLGPEVSAIAMPVTAVLYVVALALRRAVQRAAEAESRSRRAAEDYRRRLREDRLALARELHDVIAHDLTVIAMQSRIGAMTRREEDMADALSTIGDLSRSGLEDLRRLLSIMRAHEREEMPPGDPDTVPPAHPGHGPLSIDLAAALRDTGESLRRLGVDVVTEMEGTAEDVPASVRPTVVAVLKEGSTNVVKHGGSGGVCLLRLTVTGAEVELLIRNRTGSPVQQFPRSGFGIRGLRERVHRLDGTLEAGPHGDWWVVRAAVPLHVGVIRMTV